MMSKYKFRIHNAYLLKTNLSDFHNIETLIKKIS